MSGNEKLKNDFVFREGQDGELQFVGDFDGLYNSEKDPWASSGEGDVEYDKYDKYYKFSRGRLVGAIKAIGNRKTVLEVGCGLGFVIDFMAKELHGSSLNGIDISAVAIEQARKNFPKHMFDVGDIQSSDFIVDKK